MKSTKSKQSSITQTTTRKINNLVKKALKDKPVLKPAKGYIYLQDLETGDRFICGNSKGIYINSSPSSALVVVTEYQSFTITNWLTWSIVATFVL